MDYKKNKKPTVISFLGSKEARMFSNDWIELIPPLISDISCFLTFPSSQLNSQTPKKHVSVGMQGWY